MTNGIFIVDLLGPGVDVGGEGGGGCVNGADPGVDRAVVIGTAGGDKTGVVVFGNKGGLLVGREFGRSCGKKRGGHG